MDSCYSGNHILTVPYIFDSSEASRVPFYAPERDIDFTLSVSVSVSVFVCPRIVSVP